MTVLFLVGLIVIVAAIIFKIEKSKTKVVEPVKKLEVITEIKPEIAEKVIVESKIEDSSVVVEPIVEETSKKVIEIKNKTNTKAATKTKTASTTKTKKLEK
jgi:hypothetical protein